MKDLSKIKNRREHLTSLLSLEYLSRTEENHAEADRIHKGIIQLCKLRRSPYVTDRYYFGIYRVDE